MARQKSLFKVRGTLDDVTFYQLDGQHYIKKKTQLDGQRVKSDPAFQRTQENFQEFGTVGAVARQIFEAFSTMVKKTADPRMISRLNKVLHAIKKLDTTQPRGSRSPVMGLDTAEGKVLLTGFNFNRDTAVRSLLKAKPQIDAATMAISIPGFKPTDQLNPPNSATHFQLAALWARIDFANDVHEAVQTTLDPAPIDATVQDLLLSPSAPLGGDGRDLIALQVTFLMEEGGILYPLNDNSAKAAAIVAVA